MILLAATVGAGGKTWRAYLSTTGAGGVNARDRIGSGPWQNIKGTVVAQNVAGLHGENNLTLETVIDEQGGMPNGREGASEEKPNRHDILTGSTMDGMAYPAGDDMTCGNWTSNTTGKARVGHHDRANWLSAHHTQACSQDSFPETGGDGLFYCFAID